MWSCRGGLNRGLKDPGQADKMDGRNAHFIVFFLSLSLSPDSSLTHLSHQPLSVLRIRTLPLQTRWSVVERKEYHSRQAQSTTSQRPVFKSRTARVGPLLNELNIPETLPWRRPRRQNEKHAQKTGESVAPP